MVEKGKIYNINFYIEKTQILVGTTLMERQ